MLLKDIMGAPSLRPRSKMGYFLWKDKKGGFHLIWTTKGDLHYFRGKITGNKPLNIKELVKLESNDKIIQPDPLTITWETRTQADIDGVIFETPEDFKLELNLDSKRIGLNGIYCGRTLRRPIMNPFFVKLK